MERYTKLPFYAKASLLIIGMFALGCIMYFAKPLIVPLIIAGIVAILLHPLKHFFIRLKFGRVMSITLTVLLSVFVVAGLGLFIILQFSRFTETFPELIIRFDSFVTETIFWISGFFDISTQKMSSWMDGTKQDIIEKSAPLIGQTLVTIGNLFVALLLIPVYIFMILYYEPILIEFTLRAFNDGHREKVTKVVSEVKTLIQGYLTGLFIELVVVCVLDIAALLVLGVDYAILLGILAGLLNLIPYIGGIVGVALPMAISIVTEESPWIAIWVLVIFYIIQLIDNNYIVPKIVASKVKLNALVSVIVVLAFGALWGIPGMFISIPLTAIFKLIADHIESLQHIGFLLGDTMPDKSRKRLLKESTPKPGS